MPALTHSKLFGNGDSGTSNTVKKPLRITTQTAYNLTMKQRQQESQVGQVHVGQCLSEVTRLLTQRCQLDYAFPKWTQLSTPHASGSEPPENTNDGDGESGGGEQMEDGDGGGEGEGEGEGGERSQGRGGEGEYCEQQQGGDGNGEEGGGGEQDSSQGGGEDPGMSSEHPSPFITPVLTPASCSQHCNQWDRGRSCDPSPAGPRSYTCVKSSPRGRASSTSKTHSAHTGRGLWRCYT